MSLAEKISCHSESKTPSPLEMQKLRDWTSKWGDYLLALETGVIRE